MRSTLFTAHTHSPHGAPRVELGDEPPIEADGGRHDELDHRRVSIRWLVGTALTGLSGAVLLGSAAYSALDRRSHFAEAPTLAQVVRKEERGDASVNQKKGDRLVKAVDIVAAKQTFKSPTTVRAGDKEVVRNLSFSRVATPLVLASAGLSDEVPAFNPMQLMSAARNAAEGSLDTLAAEDADVSFVTRDMARDPAVQNAQAPAGELSAEEAQAQVEEFLKSVVASGARAAAALPAQMLLMRTSRAGALAYANVGEPAPPSTPFTSIEVKMVPENVTLIAKTPTSDRQPTQMEERLVVIKRGETLEEILRGQNVPKPQIAAIVSAFGGRKADQVAQEGRRIKLLFADLDGSGANMTLARISIHSEDRIEATVAVADNGRYVQVARADAPSRPIFRAKPRDDDEDDADSGGMRLYNSLYETALKQDIPKPVIGELVRIFANDIDFQRSVTPGDSFEAFYDEAEDRENKHELLFASITTRNETFKYYRFQTPDDGVIDYYDENGRSTRKFLVRKPISIGETRSGFGYRRHPILGYYKMHTGIDWAAPIGTPIFAAGNGTVIEAGWHSGYGRRVEIQHANGYVTAYNHMSGFARGVTEGVRVKQGQVIGFLGSSGLSTGPHLHYEVMVNGHFVDPMRIKLTNTREFDGKLLAEFRRERDRIESLLARVPNATRVAARGAGN